MKVIIKESTQPKKKLMAIFFSKEGKKLKTIHFGARGYTDYTLSGDEKKKAAYIKRHQARENFNDPMTAGALSRWILWNKPTRRASIADYKRRFNLQ